MEGGMREKIRKIAETHRDELGDFKRDRTAMLGLIILVAFVFVGVLAPFLAPYDPLTQRLPAARMTPNSEFLLGTDELGRDMLSRTIYGTRTSLQIGVMATAIAMIFGVLIGSISGYYGGLLDFIAMRVIDLLLSVPSLLLAILVVSILGASTHNVVIAVGIRGIGPFARVVRGSMLSIKKEYYIKSARALGASDLRIIFRHILPNSLSPIITLATLSMGSAILSAAGLSFVGLGVQPPTPEWGLMLSSGREFLLAAPHMVIFPGLAIILSVLGFNLLGDGLRDALDPRLKGII